MDALSPRYTDSMLTLSPSLKSSTPSLTDSREDLPANMPKEVDRDALLDLYRTQHERVRHALKGATR